MPETNLEGERGMGMIISIDGALSDILRNEEAFQNHLNELTWS